MCWLVRLIASRQEGILLIDGSSYRPINWHSEVTLVFLDVKQRVLCEIVLVGSAQEFAHSFGLLIVLLEFGFGAPDEVDRRHVLFAVGV